MVRMKGPLRMKEKVEVLEVENLVVSKADAFCHSVSLTCLLPSSPSLEGQIARVNAWDDGIPNSLS